MHVTTFENGRIVLSKQGRDKGRLFIVVENVNEDFVLLVDGDLRKLEKPKLKRKKHLRATPYIAENYLSKSEMNQSILDSDIRAELDQKREAYANG